MRRYNYYKKPKNSAYNIMYRTVGILFVLTMLFVWLSSGLFAKYLVAENFEDSASIYATGIKKFELLEHEAELITDADEAAEKNNVYKLTSTEVTENEYDVVLPGVYIPKDPFIRITGDRQATADGIVAYNLYVRVIEENIPDTVTYDLSTDWVLEKTESENVFVYKYNKIIHPGFSGTIYILNDNQLKVSERYVGDGNFSLSFDAWLKQTN